MARGTIASVLTGSRHIVSICVGPYCNRVGQSGFTEAHRSEDSKEGGSRKL